MEYAVIIWPAAFDHGNIVEIENIISEYGNVVYNKNLPFSYRGMRNLMILLYKDEEWSGNYWNHFRQIKYKLNPCYRKNKDIFLYVIESDSVETVLHMKDKIRELCQVEKASVHTADTIEETRMIKEIFDEENIYRNINKNYLYIYTSFIRKWLSR